jgi:hypothetical protein
MFLTLFTDSEISLIVGVKIVSYKPLVLLCVVSFSTSACKFGSEPASDTKHDLGQTSVTPKQALGDCKKDPDLDSARFPIATAYIKKIAHHIMASNPSTFSGAFSPDKFCFRIADKKEFNAFAYPATGSVTFHTSALASLTSDGNVAAIMAHELAHVTMQHVTGVPITHSDFKKVEMQLPSNSSSKVLQKKAEIETLRATYETSANQANWLLEQLSKASEKDAEAVRSIFALETILKQNTYIKDMSPSQWQKYADELNKHYLQIMGGADAEAGVASAYKIRELGELEASLTQKYQELEAITSQFKNEASQVIGIEQASNGMEREADEVGFELYLRSRMLPGEFLNSMGKLASLDSDGTFSKDFAFYYCLKNMLSAFRLIPNRGTNTHPSGCWRLFNAGSEIISHEDAYKQLMANATLAVVPGPGSLTEVQAEIASVKPIEQKPKEPSQSELDRKALCEKMEGTWQNGEYDPYCILPVKMTLEEEKALCSKYGDFWHDKCKCLPKSWKDKEIDENACNLKGSIELDPLAP